MSGRRKLGAGPLVGVVLRDDEARTEAVRKIETALRVFLEDLPADTTVRDVDTAELAAWLRVTVGGGHG